ncbi:MAG: Piwi domain-containing protein [Candidatus Geothermarchaeales archaeon]
MELSTEVFPIRTEALPELSAYRVDVGDGEAYRVGGKLSYRLRKAFPGRWAWTSGRILTDTPARPEELSQLIERLWHEQPSVFKDLRGLRQDQGWRPYPRSVAEFVARAMFPEVDREIRKVLNQDKQDLGPAILERDYKVGSWVVKGEPAVSISVKSHLIHKQDLAEYSATLSDPSDLVGLWVAAKSSTLKGEVADIAGELVEHRTRLLAITEDKANKEFLKAAPDNELVVTVQAGQNTYDYAASALRLIIRMADFPQFGIDSRRALRVMKISPDIRSNLVGLISKAAKRRDLIEKSYTSARNPDRFLAEFEDRPSLRFGGNQVRNYEERQILGNLRNLGLYRRAEKFQDDVPIRVGIINAIGLGRLDDFWARLQDDLRSLQFRTLKTREEVLRRTSRVDLERATEVLQREKVDIILAFFPERYGDYGDSRYHSFKSITVGRGIPSQVVYEATLNKPYARANIVLGVLGKTGNTPFILSEPLEYADIVVGIDIARERKKQLAGSINATAVARIYFSNGEFVRYVIHDAPLEGETVPKQVLQSLFPLNEFRDKRVVIHRDGKFRGEEKRALKDWAKRIGATFHLVEVIKSGSPRLYGKEGSRVLQPPKGSAFKLSEKEAFLVSSLPPFKDATPQPLHIRAEPPFAIEKAIDSVLKLTLLHYGSLRPPRLPVTIHYSDRIAYLALRGIKPKDLEGTIPFWL